MIQGEELDGRGGRSCTAWTLHARDGVGVGEGHGQAWGCRGGRPKENQGSPGAFHVRNRRPNRRRGRAHGRARSSVSELDPSGDSEVRGPARPWPEPLTDAEDGGGAPGHARGDAGAQVRLDRPGKTPRRPQAALPALRRDFSGTHAATSARGPVGAATSRRRRGAHVALRKGRAPGGHRRGRRRRGRAQATAAGTPRGEKEHGDAAVELSDRDGRGWTSRRDGAARTSVSLGSASSRPLRTCSGSHFRRPTGRREVAGGQGAKKISWTWADRRRFQRTPSCSRRRTQDPLFPDASP